MDSHFANSNLQNSFLMSSMSTYNKTPLINSLHDEIPLHQPPILVNSKSSLSVESYPMVFTTRMLTCLLGFLQRIL